MRSLFIYHRVLLCLLGNDHIIYYQVWYWGEGGRVGNYFFNGPLTHRRFGTPSGEGEEETVQTSRAKRGLFASAIKSNT